MLSGGLPLPSRLDYVPGKVIVPSDRHGLFDRDANVKRQERAAHRRRTNNPVADRVQFDGDEATARVHLAAMRQKGALPDR